jgi:hypothetical protein
VAASNGGNMMSERNQSVLSLIVVLGVFLLTYADKLQGQAATGLIGMIVGYLFGKGKK